ncbi:MAG: ribonuclease HI family protein [Candidatus Omnitrophica bacterium]|nr:ribonuclease HI family protein [Candidatus Omnitrophota bacterium]
MTRTKGVSLLKIFADGGSRGNPGPAGVGAVLFDETGKRVAEVSRYIGIATNNVAEYLSAIYGLQEAVHLKAKEVKLHLDSQLIARQLKGEYKVKNADLKKFFDLAVNLFREFDKLDIIEVPREQNKEADELVNKALDLKTLL